MKRLSCYERFFRYVKEHKPYRINAVFIMPDHLHSTCLDAGGRATHGGVAEHQDITVWDEDFSIPWNLCKTEYKKRHHTSTNEIRFTE